ncbi:hypothetical protein [Caballeronia sp. S22]|uniref:hypothetical protein n=1 Tax=Caballeronia sp. S22 TaxID=3137182 RepID=UPI0035314483
MKFEYVLDEHMSDESLNTFIKGAEADNTSLRAEIARNDRQIAQAKLRLLQRQIAECDE